LVGARSLAGAGSRSAPVSAQKEAVAVRDEMLVRAAKEVSAGADGHERFGSSWGVEPPLIGRAAPLDLVRCKGAGSWVQLVRRARVAAA